MGRSGANPIVLSVGLLVLAALTSCAGVEGAGDSVDPHTAGSPAAEFTPATTDGADSAADATGDEDGARTVDPGWDMAAQEADGIFLSLHETDTAIEFRAVDSTGTVVWTAQRPRVCSGFAVFESERGPVAVLMDLESSATGVMRTTASGFALDSGKRMWGPVEVPGPLLGSGLVFAGPPQEIIGVGGPRTVLNPGTGEAIADEGTDSSQVIALLGSTLIRGDGDELSGEDLDGNRLWTRPAEDFGASVAELRETPWTAIGSTHALLGDAGDQERILIDLRTGDDVATGIEEAGFDPQSRTLVTADGSLHGLDLDGTTRWETPLADDAQLTAVGDGLIVVESDSSTEAGGGDAPPAATGDYDTRSADDGRRLKSAGDTLGAPHHIAETGARLIGDRSSPLLVTAPSVPDREE